MISKLVVKQLYTIRNKNTHFLFLRRNYPLQNLKISCEQYFFKITLLEIFPAIYYTALDKIIIFDTQLLFYSIVHIRNTHNISMESVKELFYSV